MSCHLNRLELGLMDHLQDPGFDEDPHTMTDLWEALRKRDIYVTISSAPGTTSYIATAECPLGSEFPEEDETLSSAKTPMLAMRNTAVKALRLEAEGVDAT